jgi:hypothetical protein
MIKKLSTMAGVLALAACLAAPPAGAQPQAPPPAPQPPAAARQGAKLYNPQAVETVTGQVVAVNRQVARKAGRPERVTMVLKTDKETVRVHLGPGDYIDQQGMKLAPGDQVEVKGTRMTSRRGTMFMAGEVKKGGQVLKLRDDATGKPLWGTGKKSPTAP